MAGTAAVSSYDAEVAQYLARQKRTADQDRGAADAADSDAYKKLMGKFGNGGVMVSDSTKGLAAGGEGTGSRLGLETPFRLRRPLQPRPRRPRLSPRRPEQTRRSPACL